MPSLQDTLISEHRVTEVQIWGNVRSVMETFLIKSPSWLLSTEPEIGPLQLFLEVLKRLRIVTPLVNVEGLDFCYLTKKS